MAAKEHEEWNKKKKKYHLAVFLGFDYDDYINWGEWERGPQKNLKKSDKQQTTSRKSVRTPRARPALTAGSWKTFFIYFFYFFFWGGGDLLKVAWANIAAVKVVKWFKFK